MPMLLAGAKPYGETHKCLEMSQLPALGLGCITLAMKREQFGGKRNPPPPSQAALGEPKSRVLRARAVPAAGVDAPPRGAGVWGLGSAQWRRAVHLRREGLHPASP